MPSQGAGWLEDTTTTLSTAAEVIRDLPHALQDIDIRQRVTACRYSEG